MLKKYKKQRVVIVFLTVTISILLVCGIGLYKRTKVAHLNSEKIVTATTLIIEGISSTQEFILFETKTADFYESKISINLKQQDDLFLKAGNAINNLDINFLKTDNLNFDFEIFKSEIKNYNTLSSLLCFKLLEKGFKDYGKIGEMRNEIHFVEKNIDPKHEALLLSIRRHEKDYLLRNEQNYVDLLHQKTKALSLLVHDEALKVSLKKYASLFNEIVLIDKQVGLSTKNGIINNLEGSNYKLKNQLGLLSKTNHQKLNKELNAIENTFIDILVYSTLILFVGLLLSFLGSLNLSSKNKAQIGFTA